MSAPDRPTREQVDAALELVDLGKYVERDSGAVIRLATAEVLAVAVRALLAEIEPYRRLAPQTCAAGLHGDWLVDSEHSHACPWCQIYRLRAARVARTPQPAEPVLTAALTDLASTHPLPWSVDADENYGPILRDELGGEVSTTGVEEALALVVNDAYGALPEPDAPEPPRPELVDAAADLLNLYRDLTAAGASHEDARDAVVAAWRAAIVETLPVAPLPAVPDGEDVECPCCLGDPDTVCSACKSHACWAGRFMCGDADIAGIEQAVTPGKRSNGAALPASPSLHAVLVVGIERALRDLGVDLSGCAPSALTGWIIRELRQAGFLLPSPDGEDVPARLDAAADALAEWQHLSASEAIRDVAHELREIATHDVRAAVAAALALPTEREE